MFIQKTFVEKSRARPFLEMDKDKARLKTGPFIINGRIRLYRTGRNI